MAARVFSVAEPWCGERTTLGSVSSASGHARLVGEDVERGAAEPAVGEELDHRRLVDQRRRARR